MALNGLAACRASFPLAEAAWAVRPGSLAVPSANGRSCGSSGSYFSMTHRFYVPAYCVTPAPKPGKLVLCQSRGADFPLGLDRHEDTENHLAGTARSPSIFPQTDKAGSS